MKKRLVAGVILSVMLVVSGCGSAASEAEGSGAGNGADSGKVKKIVVGTSAQFPNVSFIDDKSGELTGYDIELTKEVDKLLPDYEFEFKTMDFSNLLLSLETKKVDLIANQMEKNEEREAKFLFNKEPYGIFRNRVSVDKNNDTIQSIDDLQGKKVYTTATSAAYQILVDYNKTHNDAIELVYANGAANDMVSQIQSGRADATILTDFILQFYPGADGKPALKNVGGTLSESNVFYVLRKGDQALSDKIDEALAKLRADGTMGKLSTKWLGEDFSKSE